MDESPKNSNSCTLYGIVLKFNSFVFLFCRKRDGKIKKKIPSIKINIIYHNKFMMHQKESSSKNGNDY